MKRRYIALAALMALLMLFSACGGEKPPAETSRQEAPEPPPPVSEAPPEPSAPEPEPEPEPPPSLALAEGVTGRLLCSWPTQEREWNYELLPSRGGLALVGHTRWDEHYHPAGGELLGVEMNTGEIAFTLPLSPETSVREVPAALNREFLLAEGAGYIRYAWGPGGPEERSSYTLPPEVQKALETWAEADPATRELREGWDARPEEDILAWLTAEGAWVAGANGQGARLVIAMEEIYRRPRYQEYLEEKRARVDAEIEDCLYLGRPRLMNGGRTLLVPIYNRVSLYIWDDLLVIDLATGERRWYEEALGETKTTTGLEILDDTTVLGGKMTRIDLTDGSSRVLSKWPPDLLLMLGRTSDNRTFFSQSLYELWALTAEELGDPPDGEEMQALQQKRRLVLTGEGITQIDNILAVEGRQVLFTYITDAYSNTPTTHLALVTAPE